MNDLSLRETWARQAQADAERGVIQCRICKRHAALDQAITLWRDGALVFAVCDSCSSKHDILMSPSERGIEIRAKARGPIIVRGQTA